MCSHEKDDGHECKQRGQDVKSDLGRPHNSITQRPERFLPAGGVMGKYRTTCSSPLPTRIHYKAKSWTSERLHSVRVDKPISPVLTLFICQGGLSQEGEFVAMILWIVAVNWRKICRKNFDDKKRHFILFYKCERDLQTQKVVTTCRQAAKYAVQEPERTDFTAEKLSLLLIIF